MFKSSKQTDQKKTWVKFLDYKRDGITRLKKLKTVIEGYKAQQEVKDFFVEHYRVIYTTFYEVFIQLDTVKFLKNKLAHEDIDLLMFTLEKILIYLPERIEKKWEMTGLIFVFQKLLNYSNLHMIRVEGLRLFLIFYQILGENVIRLNPKIEIMYAALVPGLVADLDRYHNPLPHITINYDDTNNFGVFPSTNEYFYPELNDGGTSYAGGNGTNLAPEQKYFFCRRLLEYSISQCGKVYWKDYRDKKHTRAFDFLMSSFARIYLPYIFPRLAVESHEDWRTWTIRNSISIYAPPTELPLLVKYTDKSHFIIYSGGALKTPQTSTGELPPWQLAKLQSIVIDWFTMHLLPRDRQTDGLNTLISCSGTLTSGGNVESPGGGYSKQSTISSISSRSMSSTSGGGGYLMSQLFGSVAPHGSANYDGELSEYDFGRVRQLLDARPFFVDLVINLFHQSFLMPYTSEYALTMKNVIKVYKQWIYREDDPPPQFLTLPPNSPPLNDVCAGCMNLYNIFIFSSVNVFLLEVPSQFDAVLTEQVELCKRALNIYRFMVMKVDMDRVVWENLVQALIQITRNIIPPQRPPLDRMDDTIGGRLAAALVQTLVVTWIKANLNVAISNQLWDDFGELLSSLTSWEEVIKEWANTMSILTRVMSRYVFSINLNDMALGEGNAKVKHRLKAAASVGGLSGGVSNGTIDSTNINGRVPPLSQPQRFPPGSSEVSARSGSSTSTFSTPNKSVDSGHSQHYRTSSNSNSTASTPTSHQAVNRSLSYDLANRKQSKCDLPRGALSIIGVAQMPIIYHQLFHRNSNVGVLVRSESDSCLMTSVANSNCGIKMGPRRNYRRSSKISRTSRLSVVYGSGSATTPKSLRNMPMIDDDDVDDDSTLADADSFHQEGIDSFEASDVYALFVDEVLGDQGISSHFRSRGLYRARSLIDLNQSLLRTSKNTALTGGGGGYARDESTMHNADTLSLGNNSLKDSPLGPLAFDSTSSGGGSVHEQMNFGGQSRSGSEHTMTTTTTQGLAVMLGGTHTGWSTEISVILWRRMLGILGDIAHIADPKLHKLALDCLAKVIEDFSRLIELIDFSVGSGETINLLLPSLHWFVAWLFKSAMELGDEFKEGKWCAYKLLCVIAIHRTSEQNITPDFLALFYLTIKKAFFKYYQIVQTHHQTLQHQPDLAEAQMLVNIIIKYCGSKFFASPLAGSSCLLNDFLYAASAIVNESDTKYPRVEALHLLGQLIGFFDVFHNVFILKSSVPRPELTPYQDLKEGVLQILISASKREPTGLGRSISLCSLGIFLYKEFLARSDSHRIREVVNILVAGTKVSIKHTGQERIASPSQGATNADHVSKFNNRVLSRVACDMLRLQADHAAYLVEKCDGDIPSRIIKGLCYTLLLHLEVAQQLKVHRDFKHLLLSLMFTLAHWCMSVPKDYLSNTLVIVDFLPVKTAEEQNGPSETTISLMGLVLYVFEAIANLNISAIVFDQSLDNVQSFGEMDTIDYTIVDHQIQQAMGRAGGLETLRRSASPTRKSFFVGNDNVWQEANTVRRAAQLILLHFHNFMGHFPSRVLRTESLCALINENDDNASIPVSQPAAKVDLEALNAPNVLVFVISDSCLMSFVELPPDSFTSALLPKLTSGGKAAAVFSGRTQPIRVIIRNLLGKFAWDCQMLQPMTWGGGGRPEVKNLLERRVDLQPLQTQHSAAKEENGTLSSLDSDSDNDDESGDSFLQSMKKDNFEMMLNEIVAANPECHLPEDNKFMRELNLLPEAVDIVALFTNQHFQETSFKRQYRKIQTQPKTLTTSPTNLNARANSQNSSPDLSSTQSSISSNIGLDPTTAFQYCRQLIDQLGFLSPEKRSSIHLLAKNQHTIRELRHLDGQRCRETHKIAVIFVGPGQESKEAILLNKSGSRAFEEFVARLGWEVNLATHIGFMGGLEANLSTGLTAPYYADSFNEIIFHVSTRLEPAASAAAVVNSNDSSLPPPMSSQQQLMTKKMRHLGNDEVHIVWSEHYKDYKRNILATDFCDALIVIYPLPTATYPNLYRIVISRKPEVIFFGPLFNGAVVHRDELPALVRATAVNASRAKRQNIVALKPFFEERHEAIHALATKYKEKSTFEEYATRIYAPRYDILDGHNPETTSSPPTTGLVGLEPFVYALNPLLRSSRSASTVPVSSPAADSISLISSNSISFDAATHSSMSSTHSTYYHHPPPGALSSVSATLSMASSTVSAAPVPIPYPVQIGGGLFQASKTVSTSSTSSRPTSRNSLGNR